MFERLTNNLLAPSGRRIWLSCQYGTPCSLELGLESSRCRSPKPPSPGKSGLEN